MISAKSLLTALALSGILGLPTASANCRLPHAPSKIPDGSTASERQMLTAMQTIEEYNSDVQTYLECLKFEVRQNELTMQVQASLHNAAINRLQQIAAEFNRQVRIFKSKHS